MKPISLAAMVAIAALSPVDHEIVEIQATCTDARRHANAPLRAESCRRRPKQDKVRSIGRKAARRRF